MFRDVGVAGSNPVTPTNYARVLLTTMSCDLRLPNTNRPQITARDGEFVTSYSLPRN